MSATFRLDRAGVLAVVLTVFAIAPLTYPGFFQAHSGFLPVYNTTHPDAAPTWGRTPDPVRGEGRLPYLIAWPFWKLAGSGAAAVKWGYGLAFALGALGAYAWTRRKLGSKGAVLAATVYTYLPWHLSTVYVRGAYAEAWLWALWPFVLWAIDRLGAAANLADARGPAIVRTGLAALALLASLAATFWVQPGLAAAFLPIAFLAVLQWQGPRWRWAALIAAAVPLIAVGIASPAARIPPADHFLYPYQLLSPAWGFGTSVAGWQDGMSFQVGITAVGLGILAIMLAGSRRTQSATDDRRPPGASDDRQARQTTEGDREVRRAVWVWAAVAAVIVVLTLPVSAFVWRITGLQGLMTYPWQVLALAALPLAFLAGSVVRLEPRPGALPAFAALTALVSLVLLTSMPYLAPRFTQVDAGTQPVALLQPVEATAPQVLLLQDEVAPPGEITPTLTVTLTWQAVEPVAGDYTVFVHLLAADGSKVAQTDSRPCDGACPTNSWQPGQIVIDRHTLALSGALTPGRYQLAVGLYLLDGGARAQVLGRDDQTVYIDVP